MINRLWKKTLRRIIKPKGISGASITMTDDRINQVRASVFKAISDLDNVFPSTEATEKLKAKLKAIVAEDDSLHVDRYNRMDNR